MGKFEVRNSKFETNSKLEFPKVTNSDFEFWTCFEFRISNFEFGGSTNLAERLTHARSFNILAPHDAEQADALAKGAEMEGLNKIGIGAEFVCPFDILLEIGTGHHDDWDESEVVRRMRVKPLEKIEATDAGHS